MVGLGLDVLTQVVNVHWGGKKFLYSGQDGMFTSSDGNNWTKLKSSVPAVSLAWMDNVWVGCGPGGVWRSEDGARSWEPVGAPVFKEVAAMKPTVNTDNPDANPGVFAGWLINDEGNNSNVYVSRDLGMTWTRALAIPTTVGEDGFEFISGLSGCGGALFVCTNQTPAQVQMGGGDPPLFVRGGSVGMIYSSTDGHSFAGKMVFGPGNEPNPVPGVFWPTKQFGAAAVGFDQKSKTYMAVAQKEEIRVYGTQMTFLVYTKSSTPSFGSGAGNEAASASQSAESGGDFIGVASSAAGGDGTHVAGLGRTNRDGGGTFLSGALEAGFIPGAIASVRPMGDPGGGYIGSFCFKSKDENGTGSGSPSGVFACVAYGADGLGGVYVAKADGHFSLTHTGTGIDISGSVRGAVAVGNA